MENFVRNSKLNIEEEIKRIELQTVDPLDRIRQIIGVVQVSLTSLKTAVAGYQFRSAEEEILFFKVSKPQISGLLMFYVRLYQIEKNRIDKSLSSQCRYLKIELENLQKLFLNNDFYEYYRVGRTELDSRYFIRENYDILSDIHCHLLDRDISFTTLHDSSVAEWTDSKVALVEFIYALYAGKCFNNGNTSLKDIAFCCETLFNIEIGDFYRIFLEIRNRKKSRTQFLDKLKEQIIKMMDELDR